MKLTLISDTHGHHRSVDITETDILIHSGDISGINKRAGVIDFLEWYSVQPAKFRILVAGNHDATLRKNKIDIPKEVIYLQDSGIEIEGLNIWGSPLTIMDYSFSSEYNEDKDKLVHETWNKIPLNTDILITHVPPEGILDLSDNNIHKGCRILYERVMDIKPKIHAFGHIHEAYGILRKDDTIFINASIVSIQEIPANEPIILNI